MTPFKLTFFCGCVLIISCLLSCRSDKKVEIENIEIAYPLVVGKTMGTTYSVKHDLIDKQLKSTFDSILVVINNSVSTYIPSSLISRINADETGKNSDILINSKPRKYIKYEFPNDLHFLNNFNRSFEIFKLTEGYFDPTIMPLVNYWGFGYTQKKPVTQVDSTKVRDLKRNLGMEKWTISIDRDNFQLIKPKNGELDFSAIAKGYAVDELARYLNKEGASNYMVEIGGEVFTKGRNDKNQKWTVGLNTPKENAGLYDFLSFVQVDNQAVASSGNYRNFYEVDGKKYGHEINPKTGFPEMTVLQGVSVIANTCMDADAYATAFMVMGLEQSKLKIKDMENVEACFFYFDESGDMAQDFSVGFEPYLKK